MEEPTCAHHLPEAAGLQYGFCADFRKAMSSYPCDTAQVSPMVAAVLCRAQAKKLWADKAAFDKLGVRLVCVVHQMPVTEYEVCVPIGMAIGCDLFAFAALTIKYRSCLAQQQ